MATVAQKKRKKDRKEFEAQEAAFKAKGGKAPEPTFSKTGEESKRREEQKIQPTIDLTKQKAPIKAKTGLAAYREKDTLGGKIAKTLTSPKTTLALGGTLATFGLGSALAAGAATGAKTIQIGSKIVKLPKGLSTIGTKINVNAIGKSAGLTKTQTAALAKRIGYERINVLARYAVNPKSISLTKKIFIGLGFTAIAASIGKDLLGTYPFAGFIKEEAIQTLSIPIMKAIGAGDMKTAREQTEAIDEILANQDTIKDKVPYINILKSLDEFFVAAEETNAAWKEITNATEEQTSFSEEKAVADEEAKQRDLAEMQWKAEYYALIREGNFEEADELLQSQS